MMRRLILQLMGNFRSLLTQKFVDTLLSKAYNIANDNAMMRKKFVKLLLSEFGVGESRIGKSGWGSSEHRKRRGLIRVKQGGTAGTSSRPCSK